MNRHGTPKCKKLERSEVFSQASKDIVDEAVGRPRKFLCKMALELEKKKEKEERL